MIRFARLIDNVSLYFMFLKAVYCYVFKKYKHKEKMKMLILGMIIVIH